MIRRRSLLVLLVALACAGPAGAQLRRPERPSKSNETLRDTFRPAVEAAARSTVTLLGEKNPVALGTVVSADGLILTKASELEGAVSCKLADGRQVAARIVGISREHDLALLKVEAAGLTPIVWARSANPDVGQWVASAAPSGPPVAVGVISVGRRRIPPRSGMLGVSLADASGGVRVMQVVPGSAAEKAGVQVDDLIVKLAGKFTPSREELTQIMADYRVGDQVALTIKRGDRQLDLTASLGQRTAAPTTAPGLRRPDPSLLAGPLSRRANDFPSVLQHDTVLRPADCGGPLVDLDGHVIGINIARAGRVESYAVPADVIQQVLPDLRSGKLAPPSTAPAARPAHVPAPSQRPPSPRPMPRMRRS